MENLSTKLYQRVTNFTFAIALVLSTLTAAVAPFLLSQDASAQAAPYSEGFEYGATDWTNTTIVDSGVDSIPSSDGSKYGQAYFNAFTRWGNQYRNTFPAGGYSTQLDLYFDPSWAASNAGQFDFSSAINRQDGNHLRDFIFTFGSNGTDAKWFVNASNNAPGNPFGTGSIALEQTGWYTIKHDFQNVDGVLEVTLSITNKLTGVVAGTWTLSNSSDTIADVVGGNRYGWFPTQRFDFLHIAVDNAKLIVNNAPQPTAPQNGGTIVSADKSVTFGWNAVEDATAYEVRYSTNADRTPNNVDGELNTNAVNLEATTSTSQTQAGLPNGTIFWQVRALAGDVTGPWSNIWSTKVVDSVIVSPDTMKGWTIATGLSDTNTTPSGGSAAFVASADAPLSEGALQVETNSSVDARVRVAKDVNVKLSSVDAISYDTKVTSAAEEYADASFRLGLDNDGDGIVDMTVVYEPYYNGDVDQNVWQTWNVKEGKFWGSWNGGGGYDSNVTINNIPGTNPNTTIRKISVGLGNYNTSWRVLVDNVRFDTTVYDFEPAAPVVVPSAAFVATPSNTAVASEGYTNEQTFTFNLSSASNTTRYEVSYWNDIEGSPFKESSPWNSDITNYSSSLGVYNDQFTQGEGTHYFAFRSCNAINECSAYSAPFQVTYDTTAPALDISETTTEGDVPTVSGTAEAGSSIVVTISGDDIATQTYTTTADEDGNWTVTGTQLELGTYQIAVVATDKAKNSTTENATLIIQEEVIDNGGDTGTGEGEGNTSGDDEDSSNDGNPATNPVVTIVTPIITNPASIVGVQGATDDNTADDAAAAGATDDKTAAVDTDATDGTIFGLAWYWWILILAALAGITWWIIGAIRRRNTEA